MGNGYKNVWKMTQYLIVWRRRRDDAFSLEYSHYLPSLWPRRYFFLKTVTCVIFVAIWTFKCWLVCAHAHMHPRDFYITAISTPCVRGRRQEIWEGIEPRLSLRRRYLGGLIFFVSGRILLHMLRWSPYRFERRFFTEMWFFPFAFFSSSMMAFQNILSTLLLDWLMTLCLENVFCFTFAS